MHQEEKQQRLNRVALRSYRQHRTQGIWTPDDATFAAALYEQATEWQRANARAAVQYAITQYRIEEMNPDPVSQGEAR